MVSQTQRSGGYSVGRDGLVLPEGSDIASLSLLIQGRLDVRISSGKEGNQAAPPESLKLSGYRLFELSQSLFLGINDLLRDAKSSLTLAAASDTSLFAYPAANEAETMAIISSQKDYGAYALNSLCVFIDNAVKALDKIGALSASTENILKNLASYIMAAAGTYGFTPVSGRVSEMGASRLAFLEERNIQPPAVFSAQFIEPDGNEGKAETGNNDESQYYVHLLQVPADIRKSFFGSDSYVASFEISRASACLDRTLNDLRQAFLLLEDSLELLYSDHADSVYKILMKAARQLKESGADHTQVLNAASYLLAKVKDISSFIESEYAHFAGIDIEYAEHVHRNAITSLEKKTVSEGAAAGPAKTVTAESLPEELKDSVQKILDYAGLPQEKTTSFIMNLSAFRNMKDKFASDDASKKIRSALTDLYFEIYAAVFRKAYGTKDDSRLIRMFLSYGYMDEKLLDQNQTLDIYKLAGADHAGSPNIYTMQEWLGKIYSMEKDPSVSHYGLDYADTFRELKKRGALTENDKAAYFANREDRLSFELENMFRQNHRICHGQMASYFPILHRDMAPQNPLRAHVSPARIQERINRILEIDFSAFHREINYLDQTKGIEKELIMMQVVPDFILIPVHGTRAMMWQEISGKVKSTPGRLLLPVFTDENLDEMILKLVGNFRWELCRTVMGVAWNDVTQPSLTSEYADYIQFYRKNNDLSEEAKEKIKALTDRYYNKLRDIFTSDYEVWVNNESRGNPRLNKVARRIFFKYCPFSKEIRDQLEKQPIYTEALTIEKRLRAKKAREYENHYKIYTKQNAPLDPVLQKNLEFYRDL